MVRILYGLDIVEIGSPVLDVALLAAGYQPFVTM